MVRHKLPQYVQAFRDRHGKQRLYFRRLGCPRTPLPGPLFSEPFYIAYHKAMAGTPEKPSAGSSKTMACTMNALIAEYYQSSAFTSKAPTTQSTYRNQLEAFRKEHGDGPVAEIKTKHIDAILGEIAKKSTAQAHKLRKRLATLFRLAVKWEYREDNPMLNADRVKHNTKGWETWEEENIATYRTRWKIGTTQRLALEILLNTGLRVSDAVRLGPQHLKDGYHIIVTQKTKKQVHIPMHSDLRPVLDAITDKHLTYLATVYGGRSRSSQGLTNSVIEAAKEAGLPPHRSAHGLRKAICVRLAEVGCDPYEIMAITGHQNLAEVMTYIAGVNVKKKAKGAMDKLSKSTA